jgi:leucyl-tRNA synthetase
MKSFDHIQIEKKWQEKWLKDGTYVVSDDSEKEKCYVLDMFPYPSGEGLHVGHPKGYIATDVYSRYKTMRGFTVLHPMGWDAFGLPAENYALKHKVHPEVAVKKNVARFKEQLEKIGFNYDWGREINTTDPRFYKWTQWIFVQMFKKGLAYESYEPINWCPSCKTGLANEDLEGNTCERCGTVVEKKPMRQWVLRITEYADRMLEDLTMLPWSESVKEMQRNWIGRSEGARIRFKIADTDDVIEVFTTRPDTLFGVTYMVLAPEHALVTKYLDTIPNKKEVEKYIATSGQKTDIERTAEGKEKTGVLLEGVHAVNPVNGENLPIFISDYVLASYGTGAIMAVPAHDERDFAFAKKFDLPIRQVIAPHHVDEKNAPRNDKKSVVRTMVHGIIRDPKTNTYLFLQWKSNPWTTFVVGGVDEGEELLEAARREIYEETGYKNLTFIKKLGGAFCSEYFAAHKDENRVAYAHGFLFDLGENSTQDEVSVEEQKKHSLHWMTLEEFEKDPHMTCSEYTYWKNMILGEDEKLFTGQGVLIDSGECTGLSTEEAKKRVTELAQGELTVQYRLQDWVFSRQRYWGEPIPIVHCEACGAVPVDEKDLPVQLPDVESYEPTGTGESPLASIDEWVNTTCPKCGGAGKRETNTMPQWAGSSWYHLRYIDPKNDTQLIDPAKDAYWAPVDVYVGGMEHATRHLIYARFWHKFLYDIGVVKSKEPYLKLYTVGLIQAEDGRKMSKRWGNVINPDDMIERMGADALRVYEMFMGPFGQAIAWSTNHMVGARRFLERVNGLKEKVEDDGLEDAVLLHKTIKKISDDIAEFSFNTAISQLMILVNDMETRSSVKTAEYKILLTLLAPFAPHITEELWEQCGETASIHLTSWPQFDEQVCAKAAVTLAVQVNGKTRGTITVAPELDTETLLHIAKELPAVKKHIKGQTILKEIVVPKKIVNIVVIS